MEFILGCNYWASNAGADMWKNFDINVVERDLKLLSEKGVEYIRIFPNWRDFQPVMPLLGGRGVLHSYCLEGERKPQNPYYLDEEMLDRFDMFLSVCEKLNIKVIVGLITGWMSGRLYIPSALFGKNILTDTTALYFQSLFVKGIISRFKSEKSIYAWDIGNEFNVLGTASNREEACVYLAMITNAVRAEDSSRILISGMAGLTLDGSWRISDQAFYTDILTTHPYPYWCQHTRIDKTLSYRTTLHPTIQTKFLSEIGKKPCLAEEIGTMGPSVCSEEKAADFLRVNMFSLLANGATGLMWWCACDQDMLESFPYSNEMVERELGMMDKNLKPKPVLEEMAKFKQFISNTDLELTSAKVDAVCILSKEQNHWGVAYMTCALLKSVGLNCSFESWENGLPDSKLYMLPSVKGAHIVEKYKLDKLKQKVRDGAVLYISMDNAVISGFEELTGVKIIDSCDTQNKGKINYLGKEIELIRRLDLEVELTTAKALAFEDNGKPAITVNNYGKGKVILLTYPLEDNLIDTHNAFDCGCNTIYKGIFSDFINENALSCSNKDVVVTYHPKENGMTVVLINHSENAQSLDIKLKDDYVIIKTIYGDVKHINAFDACIFEIKKK